MNIFYPPPVQAYTCLTSDYHACEVVERLLATNQVQFQLSSNQNPHDPYNLIHSHTRAVKHKLQKTIETIKTKYNEQIHELNAQQRKITIQQMKLYINQNGIDHLKYMDLEQQWVQKRVSGIQQMMNTYDNFSSIKEKIENELDTLRAKIEACKNNQLLQQFVVSGGICDNKNIKILQRLIFRKSKGHSITFFKSRQRNLHTSVFLCFMNKKMHQHISQKIIKACQSSDVNFYELPNQLKNMKIHQKRLIQQLKHAIQVLEVSGIELTRVLNQCIVNQGDSLVRHLLRVSYLQRLIYIVCHSKKVSSHTSLTFYAPQKMLLPELPSPISPIPSNKPRTIMPSLYCLQQANILTQLFSTPKHNQLIPSIFIFATVPVLFGMMFSDFGHGLLLLTICITFQLKPIFYFMGFMSIYCGIIYNQFFGMKILRFENLGVVQPIWAVSENGLNFQNSLKMKLAMIIAFVHMGFGMVIKIVNQKRRKQYTTIFLDSLPKIGLLFTTVGYLVYLIITKWLTEYPTPALKSTAPSIINSVLQMYLGYNQSRKHSILGTMENQKFVGSLLKKISLLLLAVMVYNQTLRGKMDNIMSLFTKGKTSSKKYAHSSGYNQLNDEIVDEIQVGQISQQLQKTRTRSLQSLHELQQTIQVAEEVPGHASQLGALEVFQFVLSLISSTTSYLRLFALSLAHAKLSALILEMLLSTLANQHPYISLMNCIVFTLVTFSMMLALDVMECIMHVVRLHWVEWMGRFYEGGGILFKPEIQGQYEK